MEIFDCFCGVGPWQRRDPLLPFEPADILKLMDHFGVSRALASSNFTTDHGSFLRGNRLLEKACAGSDRFTPAFTLAPCPCGDAPSLDEQLRAMRAAGSRAVWLSPEGGTPGSWLYGDVFEACVRHRLPVLLHRERTTPDDVHRLCLDFPSLRLLLVGLGYREDHWLFPLMRKFDPVCVSLGHFYIPPGGPMRFLRHFPADRLLFGSGLPQFSPGGLIAHVMYAEMRDEEREKILAGNLKRLLAEVTW